MKISFSAVERRAWDKLQLDRFKEGELFTTFRAYTARKDKYYSECINKEFYVVFNKTTIGKATLVKREYRWSNELTLEEIKKDTFLHWGIQEFEDMLYTFYENRKVFGFWLTFEIVKVGQINKTLESFLGEK